MSPSDNEQRCLNCQASEEQAALLSARHAGQAFWICSQCMPALIHEPQQVAAKLRALKDGDA